MLTGYYAGMMADRGGEAKRRAEVARAARKVMDDLYASTLINNQMARERYDKFPGFDQANQ